MFNTVKRTLAILLVLAMALTAVGCGGGGTKGTGTGTGTGNGSNVTTYDVASYAINSDALLAQMPAELKGTKIVFLNWYNPDEREEKDVIAAFEEKSGIDVEYRVLDHNGYGTAVAQMIQVGEQADVMRLKNPNIGNYKLLQPLTVTEFDYSGKEWDSYTMGLYTIGENTYAANLKYTPFFLPGMMFYNYQTFEDMGFEDPYELWKEGKWTWSKMREMCNTWVTENGEGYLGASTWHGAVSVSGCGGIFKKAADGVTYELDLNNPDYITQTQFMQEGRALGLFGTYLHEGFDQSKQKMLIDACDASAVQNSSEYFKKTKMMGKLKAVAVPVWDGEGATGDYYVPMHEVIGFGVPKSAKNPKAVPYFLAYMCNFANYNTDAGEGGFFVTEQIKECYMELMSIEKRSGGGIVGDIANYNSDIENFTWQIFNRVESTQLNSWLQEREYALKDSLRQYNEEVVKYAK